MPFLPILDNKHPEAQSVFEPSALLREARRQKGLLTADVPPVCILDPDGDIVRHLKGSGAARTVETWPCYYTELYSFRLAGRSAGIIGCAVGAPFAVLVAEELFASVPMGIDEAHAVGDRIAAGVIAFAGCHPFEFGQNFDPTKTAAVA